MSRIAAALEVSARRPLIVPFVTAGFPRVDSTLGIVEAMAAAGADMIEIGMPFSDPLADGPTIQAASEVALANGMTIRGVLDVVRSLRERPAMAAMPVLLMGYCNPLLRYGLEAFAADAAAAGVDGLIVPDLPLEEADAYRAVCGEAGLSVVFLMAPNTPEARVSDIDTASTDFSYCVSITGVTGAGGAGGTSTIDFLRRVAASARKPFVVGFGVKSPEQVRTLGPHAAGVVVGSALIAAMDGAPDPAATAGALVAELRQAAERVGQAGELR
jgi:tryptophan synthase alpha chain